MRTHGYTTCRYCLRTVRVANGKLCYHIPGNYQPTCRGHRTEALWVEEHALDAGGRNPIGKCMKCGEFETNPDCRQCCYEKRHEDTK